jgi:PRTRC genetic system protein E
MFTEISNLLKEGEMLRMNIFKTGQSLVVTLLPKSAEVKDPAAEQLIPLNLKGSPAELDAGFIEAVRRPLTTSTTLMTNMAEYEKSVEKAGQEARAEKDRKEAVNRHIKDAETAGKAGKKKEELEAYAKALKLDGKNIKIQLKINSLKMKTAGCGDLFSPLPAAPAKEEPPVEEPEEDKSPDNYTDENE